MSFSTSSKQKINQKELPFNLEWLSQNFGLDLKKVKKDGFDSLEIMYEIYFHDLESAKQFFNKMNDAECYPLLWDFNNCVALNKHNKDKILQAVGIWYTNTPSTPVTSQSSSELVTTAFRNLSFLATQQEKKPSHFEMYLDQTTALQKYFDLTMGAIKKNDNNVIIENLVYCFMVIEHDRQLLYQTNSYVQDHDDRNKLPPCFLDREGMIRLDHFLKVFKQLNLVPALNDYFSKITDWDTFYASYKGIEKETMDDFLFMIHNLKDVKDLTAYRGCLVWDNMNNPNNKINPYLPKLTENQTMALKLT